MRKQTISRHHDYDVKICACLNKDYKVPCESENSYHDDDKNYLK